MPVQRDTTTTTGSPEPTDGDGAAAAADLAGNGGISQAIPLPHEWNEAIKFEVHWDGRFEALQQPSAEDNLPAGELGLWERYARLTWLQLVEAWLPSTADFATTTERTQVQPRDGRPPPFPAVLTPPGNTLAVDATTLVHAALARPAAGRGVDSRWRDVRAHDGGHQGR